ncbi:MAG TPA: hypothetical protein VJ464_11815 [Blastocatellia bacterium]|nr:hypothetical protein [Blastocatellia bacterium]
MMRQVLNRCKAYSYDFLAPPSCDFIAPAEGSTLTLLEDAPPCMVVSAVDTYQNTAARFGALQGWRSASLWH